MSNPPSHRSSPPPAQPGQQHRRHSPRLHPNPNAQFTPMERIAHGWEVLADLDQRRFLLGRQVGNRRFLRERLPSASNPSKAAQGAASRTCLKRLKDNGYLERLRVFYNASSARGHETFVAGEANIITRKGADALVKHTAEVYGEVYEPRYKPSIRQFANQTINHELAINDAIIAIEYAAETHGFPVLLALDDAQLGSLSEANFGNFTPDGLLILQCGGLPLPLLLECDLGTEAVTGAAANTWTAKMIRYRDYFQRYYAGGKPGDPFFDGFAQPQVLTITTSPTRLENLRKATEKARNKSGYWFTVRANTDPATTDFFGPIWERAAFPGPHALTDLLKTT